MKFICLGYIEPDKFERMSESDRNAFLDDCFTYDDVLQRNGHFAGGEALQNASTAKTLRWKNGKVSVTDGPYAETQEVLAGYWVVECESFDRATAIANRLSACPYPAGAAAPTADVRPIVEGRAELGF